MSNIRLYLLITALFGGILFAAEARATLIAIDFDDATPGGLFTDDYLEDGFRMELIVGPFDTVAGHYDIWSFGGTNNTSYLGLDAISVNNSMVRFTDGFFNLISLEVITEPDSLNPHIIWSSAGGYRELTTAGVQLFSGETWSNLVWLDIMSGATIGLPGFDTLVFETVPEPTTMLLLGTGLVGVAGAARRRKKNQA